MGVGPEKFYRKRGSLVPLNGHHAGSRWRQEVCRGQSRVVVGMVVALVAVLGLLCRGCRAL